MTFSRRLIIKVFSLSLTSFFKFFLHNLYMVPCLNGIKYMQQQILLNFYLFHYPSCCLWNKYLSDLSLRNSLMSRHGWWFIWIHPAHILCLKLKQTGSVVLCDSTKRSGKLSRFYIHIKFYCIYRGHQMILKLIKA